MSYPTFLLPERDVAYELHSVFGGDSSGNVLERRRWWDGQRGGRKDVGGKYWIENLCCLRWGEGLGLGFMVLQVGWGEWR